MLIYLIKYVGLQVAISIKHFPKNGRIESWEKLVAVVIKIKMFLRLSIPPSQLCDIGCKPSIKTIFIIPNPLRIALSILSYCHTVII